MYVGALAGFNLSILLPMVIGLAAGAVGISFIMSLLFRRFYTASYSIIFGIFLSMIPNMLTPECILTQNKESVLSVIVMLLGIFVSWYLGDLQQNTAKFKTRFSDKKK